MILPGELAFPKNWKIVFQASENDFGFKSLKIWRHFRRCLPEFLLVPWAFPVFEFWLPWLVFQLQRLQKGYADLLFSLDWFWAHFSTFSLVGIEPPPKMISKKKNLIITWKGVLVLFILDFTVFVNFYQPLFPIRSRVLSSNNYRSGQLPFVVSFPLQWIFPWLFFLAAFALWWLLRPFSP